MEVKRVLILLAVAGLLLAGCGDKAAIDRAKARQIEQESDDQHREEILRQDREQTDWQSTREISNLAKQVFTAVVMFSLAVSILFVLAILVLRTHQVSRALPLYTMQRAAIKARLINVDKETLTLPVLLSDQTIHNLETAEVYLLDAPKPADSQQVTGSILIRALGVGAKAAEKISKETKDVKAARALPGVTRAVPLVLKALPPGQSRRPNQEEEAT